MDDQHVKTDAEIVVILPQIKAKECGQPSKARKGQEKFFPRVFGRNMAQPTI